MGCLMRPTHLVKVEHGSLVCEMTCRVIFNLRAMDWHDRLVAAQEDDEERGGSPRKSVDCCVSLIESEVVSLDRFERDGVEYPIQEVGWLDDLLASISIQELVAISMGVMTGGQRTEGKSES